METTSKMLMPRETRSVEAIEGLADYKNTAFKLTKLRTNYDADLLCCFCFY